jgi:hypothetical protein
MRTSPPPELPENSFAIFSASFCVGAVALALSAPSLVTLQSPGFFVF